MIKNQNSILNIVKKSLSLRTDYSKEVNSKDMFVVGQCPKCNEDVIQTSGVYSCRGKLLDTCDFKRPALFEGAYVEFEEVLRFEKYQKMINNGFNKNSSLNVTEPASNPVSNAETTKVEAELQVLGSCPKCGGNVVNKNSKYACCKCDYKLNKTFFKTKIEPATVQILLKGEFTDLMKFTRKNGETEESRLMLDSKNYNYALVKKSVSNKVSTKPEVKEEEKKVKNNSNTSSTSNQSNPSNKKILGKCPICNKNIITGKNAFGCFGLTDSTCTFKIPFKFDEMSINSEDIIKLLKGETVSKEDSTKKEVFLKIDADGILEKVPF